MKRRKRQFAKHPSEQPLPYIIKRQPIVRPERPLLKVAHHAIVKWAYETVRCSDHDFGTIAVKAGVSHNFFYGLNRGYIPRINAIDDILQTLGYRLAIVDEKGNVVL